MVWLRVKGKPGLGRDRLQRIRIRRLQGHIQRLQSPFGIRDLDLHAAAQGKRIDNLAAGQVSSYGQPQSASSRLARLMV